MDLTSAEIRVLGCLLEKQRTTPDHYPLSLNSLRLACNQSTNREPVVQYDEATIRDALHRLERRGFTRLAGAGRAAKYRHLLAEALPMSSAEQAVICVLMLRGPQTPGELKQRGERMHPFADLAEVHATLSALIDRELVSRLGRRPGQKEERYAQLLSDREGAADEPAQFAAAAAGAPTAPSYSSHGSPSASHGVAGASHGSTNEPNGSVGAIDGGLRERVERLEREVAQLREVIQS